MNKKILITSALILFASLAQGQTSMIPDQSRPSYPIVGKLSPGFHIKDVHYFRKKETGLDDFRGKPLIVDMFSLGCTSCFAEFPKMETLRNEYADKVQFLLIGQDSKKYHERLVKSYEVFRNKYKLGFTVSYDSAIFPQFKVEGVPHTVWIDENGIVQAVTTGEVTKANIENLLAGRQIIGQDKSYAAKQSRATSFDRKKPFLVSGNGGPDSGFVQRSVLSKWKLGMPIIDALSIDQLKEAGLPLQILGASLEKLYRLAYLDRSNDWFYRDTQFYGKYRFLPLLEIEDKSPFRYDYAEGSGLYCYSQILPPEKASTKNMMRIMQRDLANYFGYEVTIETRKTPCLKLVATKQAKDQLRTKGGKPDINGGTKSITGIKITNLPLASFIEEINLSAGLTSKDIIIVDETAIDYRVDIDFDAVVTDFEDVKKEINKIGLGFVPGEIEMKVIVIRDGTSTEKLTQEEKLALEVQNNNVEYFKALLKADKENVEGIRIKGYPVLCYSIMQGKKELTEFLIINNINLNVSCHQKPLIVSAAKYNNLQAVKLLCEKTGDVNVTDGNRQTALISASKYGNKEIVKYLLERKADKTLKDFDNKSAIDYAIAFKHTEIVDLLKSN